MTAVDLHRDPEDIFAETRMSFGDHIEELRTHLIRAILGLVAGMVVSIFLAYPALQFIAKPVREQLQRFEDRRVERLKKSLEEGDADATALNQLQTVTVFVSPKVMRKTLNLKEDGPPPEDGAAPELVPFEFKVPPLSWSLNMQAAQRALKRDETGLVVFNITEGFMVYMKLIIVLGFIVGSPWIFYQLWSFVAAGLYPSEKKLVHVYLPFSLALFIAGVVMCELWVIPQAVKYLLEFNDWIGMEVELRLNEWLSFAIWTPLLFGLAFQTPLVMMFLAKTHIVTVDMLKRQRRIAWFLIAVLAVIVTPSPDPFTYCITWIPLWALYELGILLAKYATRNDESDLDLSEPEEMVEV
jgi:sec-independent protein translocase protein TatC